ncbi:MAG: thiamine phosphate synthase [Paludibacteraceae bacterium]|nr:thiamine phosphate synthase [Paludibacteraceae bacterium]
MPIFKCEHPQLVVITRPDLYDGEGGQIAELLASDPDFLLHLRKPEATADAYRKILREVPDEYLHRVTLGDCFELTDEFRVGGVHLSGRQSSYRGVRKVRISKSCHSFEELSEAASYDYVFFSPIFNSISKQGYMAAFSEAALLKASASGLINEKVIALGGVDENTLPQLSPFAFGGAAVLGCVWRDFSTERFKRLADLVGGRR